MKKTTMLPTAADLPCELEKDEVAQEVIQEVINEIYDPYSIEEIEKFIMGAGSDDLPTFGGSVVGGIYLQQVPSELASCIKSLIDSGQAIQSYLEVGVAAGGTTFIINHFFHPSRIVLIDDNQHPKSRFRASILRGIPTTEIIGNSHEEKVITNTNTTEPFDFIFLDGDNSYEGTMADVTNYASKLTSGGFLAIHDTGFKSWGVSKVVRELVDGSDFTFIGEWIAKEGPFCGIALFRKDIDTI
jgi:predicted O-methyltransferase YrrM